MTRKFIIRILLAFSILAGNAILLPSLWADEATPSGFSRVYVSIQSNGKGAALSAIAAAGGKVHYEFDSIGAVAATLPDNALDALSRNAAVRGIELDPERYLLAGTQTTPYGVTAVQGPNAVSAVVTLVDTGAPNVVVGIIDTGIYPGHEDFAGVTLDGYPSQTRVRIPGRGKPTYTMEDLTEDDEKYWGRDYYGHGTHVAGTIAAVDNSLGVVGVAPGNVDIFMVKVFGDTGNWVYSSTLLNAVQKARTEGGAQVINMSLGGPTYSSTEEAGMAQLDSQGVLLVAAAGNAGGTAFSYPASYDSVISVGAVNSDNIVADFSQKNDQVELVAPGVAVLSTLPYIDETSVVYSLGTLQANGIEFAALTTGVAGTLVDGGLADSIDTKWSGKIVLVERGSISFNDKVSNVKASGGIAVIIYNNVDGELLATLGDGNSSTIPAVSLSKAHGTALKVDLGKSVTVVNDFQIPASGYEKWDGTSMATPHVAGVAALLRRAYPDASNQNIRDAMTESATDLGNIIGRDDSYGFGLVQAMAALDALPGIIADNPVVDEETTALEITGGPNSSALKKNGSFDITWTTNEPATSDVSIGGNWYPSSTLATSHKRKFRGTKGATYDYMVSSTNESGTSTVTATGTHQN